MKHLLFALFFLPKLLSYEGSQKELEIRTAQAEAQVHNLEKERYRLFYGNPSSHYCPSEHHPFLTADFLFWEAYQDGLSYVLQAETPVSSSQGPIEGSFLELKKEYKPGFRLGLGSVLSHDNWDLFCYWTSYTSKITDSQPGGVPPNSSLLVPLFVDAELQEALLDNSVQLAKANWNLKFHTVDLEIGRDYLISSFLSLRPHFGIKSAWIDQTLHTFYSSEVNLFLNADTLVDNDFYGMGLKMGTSFRFAFTRSISLFTQASAAMLYGKVDMNQSQNSSNLQFAITDASTSRVLYNEEIQKIFPHLQVIAGLRWQKCFNGKVLFSVSANYETQLWWNQFQGRIQTDATTANSSYRLNGDLSLQGLSLEARLDF